MILSLFRKDPLKDAADALYAAAAEQARRPEFYLSYGVDDTVEGRFEMAALHAWLLLRRLRDAGKDARKLSRALSDIFFAEMDGALRELGVGDLSVGRKIRAMAEAFYGRIAAYEAALKELDEPDALASALARNVYGSKDAAKANHLANYVRHSIAALAEQPTGRIALGIAAFADPNSDGRSP